jgi:hypothetical protein
MIILFGSIWASSIFAQTETDHLERNLKMIDGTEKFKAEIENEIFGQDSLVLSITVATLKLFQNSRISGGKKPLSLVITGPRGTGKNQVALKLAKSIFPQIDHRPTSSLIHFLNFSILNPDSFDQIKKIIAETLNSMPQGGVIIFKDFDELKSMNKNLFLLFFNFLAELIELNHWVDLDGKNWDLSPFIFIFTLHEGEKYFTNQMSDNIKKTLWFHYSSRQKLHDLLLKNEYPVNFINRISMINLSGPLLLESRLKIVEKLMGSKIKFFEEQFKIKITTNADFSYLFQQAFFNHDSGAKGLDKFMEEEIFSEIITKILTRKISFNDINSIDLILQDNLPQRPYAAVDFVRKVNLKLKLRFNLSADNSESEESFDLDMTNMASKARLVTKELAQRISYHEVGHALSNDQDLTGDFVGYISIVPSKTNEGHSLGYTKITSRDKPLEHQLTLFEVLGKISHLVGGYVSENLVYGFAGGGSSSDFKKAQALSYEAVVKHSLVKGFCGIIHTEVGPVFTVDQANLLQKEVEKILNMGLILSRNTLLANWIKVEKCVDHLMEKGTMNEVTFSEINLLDSVLDLKLDSCQINPPKNRIKMLGVSDENQLLVENVLIENILQILQEAPISVYEKYKNILQVTPSNSSVENQTNQALQQFRIRQREN